MRRLAPFAFAALAFAPAPAGACGGCFQPPDSVSSVTDHRMVIALSNTQTTLWDQIQYSGKPGDFVWVLPTPDPANVELAHQEFFDALETQTAPTIIPAATARANSGVGCGSGGFAASSPRADEGEDVTVFHMGTVGPYETATVGSDDPQALISWLNNHGYAVPDAMKETIAWYVDQKWVFNALRLKPDASIQQMQPVRVVFPGLAATFPLRMVAAGAAAELGILLWVIADQRYQAANYDTVTIDENRLVWSTASNRSNYRELFTATIAEHKMGAFVTEYSDRLQPASFPMIAMDDLVTAGVGQGPTIRLTRLRTSLPPSLLTRDLTLTPSVSNATVSNVHRLQAGQQQSEPIGLLEGGRRSPYFAGALAMAIACLLARRRFRH